MSIDNIKAFIYVHHFGSVNRAAQALFLSQPTVTARIQSLERELDVTLFERAGRRLIMTEKAREFLPYAESIVESYRNGKKHIQKKSAIDELVIGCTVIVSHYLIPQIMPIFQQSYPSLKIKIVTATTEDIESKVVNREVDIGFVRTTSNPIIVSKKVFQSPIRFFVQTNNRFFDQQLKDFKVLANEPIVFYECGSLDWTLIKNLFHHLHYFPNVSYDVDSLEVAKALILNNVGVGFLPEISVRQEVSSGQLSVVELPFKINASLKIEMIYLKEEKSPYVDAIYKLANEQKKAII